MGVSVDFHSTTKLCNTLVSDCPYEKLVSNALGVMFGVSLIFIKNIS